MSGLAGRSVVVTRPPAQAPGLAARIEQLGGRALTYPTIDIAPHADAVLEGLVERLQEFDLAVFISRNAVDYGLACVLARRAWPQPLRLAAIGAGTRSALESHGLGPVLAPGGHADSEALLALPEMSAVSGLRIVVFRGQGGRALLAETLRARGASVEYAECYRRILPDTDMAPLLAEWARGGVDAIAVSSGQALGNFARLVGAEGLRRFAQTPVFVPHPRVAEQARALGAQQVLTAGPSDAEMIQALVAYFSASR